MSEVDRSLEAITARLQGMADIPVYDETRGQKHYGFALGVGNSTLKSIWHCTDDRTHPEEAEFIAKGWDTADLYCDSHYASIGDVAAFEFLLNAREDMAALLKLLGVSVELRGDDDD